MGPVAARHRPRHPGRGTARRGPLARGTGRGTRRRDGPTALRFSKGAVTEDIRSVERLADGTDILYRSSPQAADVLIVGVGAFCALAVDTAERLARQGIESTVVDPRWVLPVADSIVDVARNHRLVVTVEDSGVHGGVGSAIGDRLRTAGLDVPVHNLGIAQEFLTHGSRGELLGDLGLTAQDIARTITSTVSTMQSSSPVDDVTDPKPADSRPADPQRTARRRAEQQ